MKIFIAILWFLVFTKLLVFWVWLWQMKEYHWGRFLAHFETQKIKKLFFSFHGVRYPKLTSKTIIILISGILLEILLLYFYSFPVLLVSIILAPVISSLLVLLIQIPTIILVKRTLKKAKEKREQFKNLIVIGITGSYGKSSTKEFLATILSEKVYPVKSSKAGAEQFNRVKVLKTPKNINAEIGIAKTILNELRPEHQIFIAEIGAYERGKIKEVCRVLGPKIGILTGINEQHLSTFGSQENIKKAKFELIESLPEDGIAIIRDKLDLRADDIRVEKEYIFFKVNGVDFKANLLGVHNIDNILLSASCAQKLGMSLEEISRACLKIRPEQGGMKFLRKESPTIIDSSYSANPDGVIADLDYLKTLRQGLRLSSAECPQGKLIIVMPCLIELGKAAKEVHQRIGRKIAEVCDLAIITTKDYFKEIKKEAPNALLLEKPKEIIARIKQFSGKDSVILLEGRIPKEIKSVKFF